MIPATVSPPKKTPGIFFIFELIKELGVERLRFEGQSFHNRSTLVIRRITESTYNSNEQPPATAERNGIARRNRPCRQEDSLPGNRLPKSTMRRGEVLNVTASSNGGLLQETNGGGDGII